MKKNVASQVIGAQMVDATDGSPFTGTVDVFVTVDGGTQAAGTANSGEATHEGNGFHTYAPSQAETNGDHVAFTFVASDAVPVTVQVYTSFPQTGDSFTRLGEPVAASISADIQIIDGVVDAIAAVTDLLPDSGALDDLADIKVQTDKLTFTVAGAVDANITHVNDTEVIGDGETGTEWGPAP